MKKPIRSFFLLLLLLATMLLYMRPAQAAPPIEERFALVQDHWQANVVGDEVFVERQVQLDEQLTPLVRGSPALQPAALEISLLASEAYDVNCRVQDDTRRLSLICNYRLAVSGQRITLPEDTFLYFLMNSPVELAQGVHIDSAGELLVPGILSGIPAGRAISLGNGGHYERRYGLSSLSSLVVQGETRLPPGQLPAAGSFAPVSVPFLPRFQPTTAAWIALLLALILTLLAVSRLFPVRARLPLEPQLWEPDLERIPFFLQAVVMLLVRLVNWLKQSWPRLLNAGVGGLLVLLGVQVLFIAWNMSHVNDSFVLPLQTFLESLPLLAPPALLFWPGWPYVVGFSGVIILLAGVGMLARQEIARLLVAGSALALFGAVILTWPGTLLAPTFLPAQLELVIATGAAMLIVLAFFTRGLMHPQFRRYYQGMTDDDS